MKTINRNITRLFPTLLFQIKTEFDFESLSEKVKDLEGSGYGNVMTNPTYHFESNDDLYNLEEFKEISDYILDETGKILDHLHVKRSGHYLTSLWANVADVNHQHHFHNHPNSFLSGLIYLRCPVGCAQTTFQHPSTTGFMIYPDYDEYDFDNSKLYSEEPEVGKMIVWTSNCMHGVFNRSKTPINLDDKRIVLVFNIMIETEVQRHTTKIKYKK